jgi:murein lipoprotein
MLRVFVETDGFKPQRSLVARPSQSSYLFQLKLNAGHMTPGKGRYIPDTPDEGGMDMYLTKQPLAMARTLGVAIIATLGLASCATYDEEFATINSRLDQLDSKVQGAAQSAESANQSAQQANQRLDQIESRVQQLEAAPSRKPRG